MTLPATGSVIATDDISSVHYERGKVTLGAEGVATADLDGTAARGAYVDPRLKVVRLQITPTISTTIYAAKDAIGGLLTFSNAARASGGTIFIQSLVVVDKDQERADMELYLSRATFTAPTDNAVFDPTDAELLDCVGVIGVGPWYDFNDNAVASVNNIGLECSLAGTDLFGALVSRGTPTYTSTSDIVVTLTIAQD